jgi:hypothetical protein
VWPQFCRTRGAIQEGDGAGEKANTVREALNNARHG